jgi:hypothetical protein
MGFDAKLWLTTDKLCSYIDASVAPLFTALLPSLLDGVSNG